MSHDNLSLRFAPPRGPAPGKLRVSGLSRAALLGLAAAVAVASITMTAQPSIASQRPVRSGTIAGWGPTWVAMSNGEAWDCGASQMDRPGNPECLAWLHSGCNPALAGRNPAVTASIENVGKLAGGTKPRHFNWSAISYPGWGIGGGVVVQFWRKDCTGIRASTWRSVEWYGPGRWDTRHSTTFRIPADAAWMTVTTNDTADLRWTLH